MTFIWNDVQNGDGAHSIRTKINGLGNQQSVTYVNKTVNKSDWVSDSTYAEFEYKADIVCDGITEDYVANVIMGSPQALSGWFHPNTITQNNIVTIYSRLVPDAFVIPTIICTKKGVS